MLFLVDIENPQILIIVSFFLMSMFWKAKEQLTRIMFLAKNYKNKRPWKLKGLSSSGTHKMG